MKDIKIFACPTAEEFTKEICDTLSLKMGRVECYKFANDNNFVQFKETVREQDIYLIQTTEPPVNERIMELLIMIDAAKRASAHRINVVLPYFIYSRSDKKDQPRVPVTARLFAELLEAAGASRVITCDLHNPAIQAYFNIPCDKITGQHLLQKYFDDKDIENKVVVATDAGSSITLIDKRRVGNDDKAVAANIIGDVKGKTALIFDDEVSTAGTMVEAAKILKDHGAKEIYAACTHGILCGPAIERIQNSPIKELVTTNTVPLTKEKQIDKIKVLSIAPLFAEAIKRVNEAQPLGDLFDFDK